MQNTIEDTNTGSISADKILVALSGGVDSTVCVKILQEQGFNVRGVVISFSSASVTAVAAAEKAATELEIPLSVFHAEELFQKHVVSPFCDEYINGHTPNPCVMCNPNVKFAALLAEADRLGIYYIATGHYARIEEHSGTWYIAQAESTARDQSYMLYRLSQKALKRLCLPLGEFEKPFIRELAESHGLSSANSPDSQEICFIPDGDYASYIESLGLKSKQGNFISPDGSIIAPHKGVLHYTIGQRRGLGISLGKPIFVKKIAENGDVFLAYSGEEFSAAITIANTVTTNGQPLSESEKYFVKIRSAANPVPCYIQKIGTDYKILFDEPQRAPAPGQSAVLYQNCRVVGGGFIQTTIDNK